MGIISPYPEFTRLALETAAKLGVEPLVDEGELERGVAVARRWESEQAVDVVMARGLTGIMVKNALSLPVTIIKITGFDMLDALHRARLVGGRIALLHYAQQDWDYDFAHLSRIAGVAFEPLTYRTPAEMEQCLDAAVRAGFTTIVGTETGMVEPARRHHLTGVQVHTGREALQDAFSYAASQCRRAQREKVRSWRNQTVLDAASDGIVLVDEDGSVIVFNRSAERLLSIQARDVLGRRVSDLGDHPLLGPLLADSQPMRAELLQVRDLQLVVNRATLQAGHLVVSFQAAAQIQVLEAKIRKQLHAKGLVARYNFGSLVGTCPAFQQTVERARLFAATELSVLLTGKSGTGKELLAHAIHSASRRANGPFVAVNCAALPESLLESELFGYEEGAFTGARKGGKPGLFELAHGGTIFLDEVGEVSLGPQSRLLRVLQNREVMRVGGDRLTPVDVRVVAATNRDLAEAVATGRFREDLYYRLNVLHVHMPSLRERREDVPTLARHILTTFQQRTGLRVALPDAALPLLQEYDWPGNVRELENFLQRYAVLSLNAADQTAVVQALMHDLQGSRQPFSARVPPNHLLVELGTLDEIEMQVLRQLDRQTGYDRTALARMLGISRSTLWRKLKSAPGMEH
ncbi:MAG TPA: sigma 54-interacting transcriptional regulator [Symbiobacteriaceae bacterium]